MIRWAALTGPTPGSANRAGRRGVDQSVEFPFVGADLFVQQPDALGQAAQVGRRTRSAGRCRGMNSQCGARGGLPGVDCRRTGSRGWSGAVSSSALNTLIAAVRVVLACSGAPAGCATPPGRRRCAAGRDGLRPGRCGRPGGRRPSRRAARPASHALRPAGLDDLLACR